MRYGADNTSEEVLAGYQVNVSQPNRPTTSRWETHFKRKPSISNKNNADTKTRKSSQLLVKTTNKQQAVSKWSNFLNLDASGDVESESE